ncbi:hypothetical protein [Parashewanella spongiae]|nr:hypothetical protein [Parashewanella spongiae]
MTGKINEEIEQAQKDARSALIDAEKASVNLAKRTFILKVVVAGISLGSLLLSIIPTVLTGGTGALLTAILTPLTLIAISDAACAFADWQSQKSGESGLPMKSDSLGNFFYLIVKLFHLKENTMQTAAKWSAIVVKVIFTVGILWAIDTGKDFLLESGDITTPLASLVTQLTAMFLEKSGLSETEESVQQLANKKKNAKQLLDQIKLQYLQLDLLINQQRQAEKEFHDEFQGVIQKAKHYTQTKELQREAQKKRIEAWEKLIESSDRNIKEQFQEMMLTEAKTSRSRQTSKRHLSIRGQHIFSPSQVTLSLAPEQMKSHVSDAKAATQKARDALTQLHRSQVKHARNSFIGKIVKIPITLFGFGVAVAATATSMGAASPLVVFVGGSLVIAIGDAVHAYKDWKLKANKQDGLPYGWDWIANEEYQRQIRRHHTVKQSDKRAQSATIATRLIFTAGTSLSSGEKVELVDTIDSALGKVESICDNICDDASNEENVSVQESTSESSHQDAEQIQEAMHQRQIASTAYSDNTMIIQKQSEREMKRLRQRSMQLEEENAQFKRLNNAYIAAFNTLPDALKDKLEPLIQAAPELCQQKELDCRLVSRDLTIDW